MRTFSRWLPYERPANLGPRGLAVAAVTVGLIAWAWFGQVGLLPVAIAAIGLGLLLAKDAFRIRQLVTGREPEGICSFARAFPRPSREPWVIRAVYDEISSLVRTSGRPLSLRPTDRLLEDLGLGAESLEELVEETAARSRRSLANPELNPYYRRIHTAGDLVRFLSGQPPLTAT